jgi:hypothetical protein
VSLSKYIFFASFFWFVVFLVEVRKFYLHMTDINIIFALQIIKFFIFITVGFKMALVRNAILGDLSGKIGGVVFSNNKAGSIVRKRVRGTNPRTAAQTAARQKFGVGSGAWDALSNSEQGNYRDFAKSGYRPFSKQNKGNFTGAQAFRSVNTVVQNAIAKYLVAVFAHGTGPEVPLVHTDSMPAVDPNAPVASVNATIANGVGSFKFLSISNMVLKDNYTIKFDLNFEPSSPAFAGDQFIDSNGIDFGLSLYCSPRVKKEGSSVSNKLFYNIGFSGIPDFDPVALTGFNQIHCSWDFSTLVANFGSFPALGQNVYITACVVGSNGTIARIGDIFTTIIAH